MNKLTKNLMIAAVSIIATINIASAETLNESTPGNMSCQEFIDMNPKAMTPVVFWVVNKDTDFKGGDYVDWHEVETISVPQLIKICQQKPKSLLHDWVNDLK